MITDKNGNTWYKLGLHVHTSLSDGQKTPQEVAERYKANGYDAIALTDHWHYGPGGQLGGLHILSGCEYNLRGQDATVGVMHIVGFGMKTEPALTRESTRQQIVDANNACGGIAILAHPAWSLNTAEQILEVCGFDGTEIYNSVSECGMSDRPYSGLIVDMLGAKGMFMPLLATDDVHYYNGDEMKGMIMVEADAVEELGILGAIKANRFYATQGPEIHFERISDTEVRVKCSPAVKVMFLSELPWTRNRAHRGKDITEAVYEIRVAQEEKYVRAEVTDANGLCAWSHVIVTGM